MTPDRSRELEGVMLDKFRDARAVITNARIPGISELAQSAWKKVESGEIALAFGSFKDRPVSPATQFGYNLRASGSGVISIKTLLLDPGKMQSLSKEEIAADFVLTAAVIEQVPGSNGKPQTLADQASWKVGYSRPLVEVYDDAFAKQEQWLNHHSFPVIAVDPRKGREEAFTKLFGSILEASDIGYMDWREAAEEGKYARPDIAVDFENAKNAREVFFAMRDTRTGLIMMESASDGNHYMYKEPDVRRREAAKYYLKCLFDTIIPAGRAEAHAASKYN